MKNNTTPKEKLTIQFRINSLKNNSHFRLIIFILVETTFLVFTTLSMDYSIGNTAPLINCLCFLFIIFEVAFFHYHFILSAILFVKVVSLFACNFLVGNLNYFIDFSLCYLLLKISTYIIYNKHNLREFTFPLTRKELFRRSLSRYNSSFIISQLLIFFICLFLQKNIYELIIPSVFILVSIYKDKKERNWDKIPFLSYYKTTIIEFVLLCVIVFSIKNFRAVGNLEKDTIVSALVAVFVFNITTLFILIQFNYNKYGSTYLLKTIISIPILFFTIIIPVCIILFLGFFAETLITDTGILATVKFCCFTAVFISSLLYLLLFSQSLESWKLLNSILLSVNDIDIRTNKNSIIQYDETKFDAITRIIKTDISKNDLIALRSDLYGIVCWSKNNIIKIKSQSNIYWEEIDNRFACFYKDIAVLVAKGNNNNIKDIYLNSLRAFILPVVNHKNFNDYKIFFESAVEYIRICLENDLQNNASDALYFVKHYLSQTIINFTDNGNDKFELTHSFLEPVRDFASSAIKNKQTFFVKRLNLIKTIFELYEKDVPIKWTENYLDFFLCFKSVLKEMLRNADIDNLYINEVSAELEHICNGLKLQDEKEKWVSAFWDHYFDFAQLLIYTGIQKKLILDDFNFVAFYNVYFTWNRKKYENYDVFEKCLICFTNSLNTYIKYLEESGNTQKDYFIQCIWSRFLQIENYIKDNHKIYTDWKEFKDLFENEFPILRDYDKFNKLASESFRTIVGFDYSNLDIRKMKNNSTFDRSKTNE